MGSTVRMSGQVGKVFKSYQEEDPVKNYCLANSTPRHPVQLKLMQETMKLERSRMLGAPLGPALSLQHWLSLKTAVLLPVMLATLTQSWRGDTGPRLELRTSSSWRSRQPRRLSVTWWLRVRGTPSTLLSSMLTRKDTTTTMSCVSS